MSHEHSITNLLQELQAGESAVAQEIWQRCISGLVKEARKKLRGLPLRAVDEEDVALEAFDAFLRGVEEDRFAKLENRDDLWQVLVMLTERRAIAVRRREGADKRGGGENRGESVFEQMGGGSAAGAGIDQVTEPSPAMVEMFTLEVRELLEILDDELLNKLAIGKMEGYKNEELAQQLGMSERAVRRKLHLIRQKWQRELRE